MRAGQNQTVIAPRCGKPCRLFGRAGRSYEADLETMIRKSGMRFDPEEAFG